MAIGAEGEAQKIGLMRAFAEPGIRIVPQTVVAQVENGNGLAVLRFLNPVTVVQNRKIVSIRSLMRAFAEPGIRIVPQTVVAQVENGNGLAVLRFLNPVTVVQNRKIVSIRTERKRCGEAVCLLGMPRNRHPQQLAGG